MSKGQNKVIVNKSQFIDNLATKVGCKKTEAKNSLNHVLECIMETLKTADELRFIGFGVYKAKNVSSRVVTTPGGKKVNVPENRQVRFSVGNTFKETINSK